MTAGIAAVNNHRNMVPEFPIHECPRLLAEHLGVNSRLLFLSQQIPLFIFYSMVVLLILAIIP